VEVEVGGPDGRELRALRRRWRGGLRERRWRRRRFLDGVADVVAEKRAEERSGQGTDPGAGGAFVVVRAVLDLAHAEAAARGAERRTEEAAADGACAPA